MKPLVALALGALFAGACGEEPVTATTQVSLALPARVRCAAPPADIKAELFISGFETPCSLTVDAAGQASGVCPNVTARVDRTLTLDYFLDKTLTTPPVGVANPYRLLLAQARKRVPLAKPTSDHLKVEFTDDEFSADGDCQDMTRIDPETWQGATQVTDFAATGTPCDVDGDIGARGGNLWELCQNPPKDPLNSNL